MYIYIPNKYIPCAEVYNSSDRKQEKKMMETADLSIWLWSEGLGVPIPHYASLTGAQSNNA